MIDPDCHRLELARRFGAMHVPAPDADTLIAVLGVRAGFELCEDLVAAGGAIANIGVHGAGLRGRERPMRVHDLSQEPCAHCTRLVAL